MLGVLAVLATLLFPAVARGVAAARSASCTSNLREMHLAYELYMQDHDQQFFPWMENTVSGRLWYWGLETKGGSGEGGRTLDRNRARLAPYLGVGTVETCPDFPYGATTFKRKFETASYGYGLNVYLIKDMPEQRASGVARYDQVVRPSATILWADAAQVNRFQAPATPGHPLLEEWYYVDGRAGELPKYHFRHRGTVNAAFGDGRVEALPPTLLLSYCDGKVGYLEPRGSADRLVTSR